MTALSKNRSRELEFRSAPVLGRAEHQLVRAEAGHVSGELVDEEPRQRHPAHLVVLRRALHELAADLGG